MSYPILSIDMARDQAKSDARKNERQPPILKDQGEVLEVHTTMFKLTVCREAA